MPPPPPPQLMDDLVEEILLRLPPDSPASLVRAGLVCKRWCHLVSDPGFQRRFRDFHGRAPPMLGFMIYSYHDDTTHFVPTPSSGSGLPHTDHRGLRLCDARHGRVLLHPYPPGGHCSFPIIVWNPITGEQLELSKPPRWYQYRWTAAVLCAATATGVCDHLDCHRGPFVVVLVGTTLSNRFTCIYSSEAAVWSEPTAAPHSFESTSSIASSMRSTLVGNTLYFVLDGDKSILDYNLCTKRTSVINQPKNTSCGYSGLTQLTTVEDGRLGLVRVADHSRLCLWSREVEETGEWVLSIVIELDKLLIPRLNDRRVSYSWR